MELKELIKEKEDMANIEIKVSQYYTNAAYYSAMPESVFAALEAAFLRGDETCTVHKADFDRMADGYRAKAGN